MGTVALAYGTAGQAIACTLANLAGTSATAGQGSTAVANTGSLDALVSGRIVMNAGTPANDQVIYVYAYGNVGPSYYTEGVTGTDGAVTLNNPTSLKLIGVIPTPTASATYTAGPWSVASAFGGVLPASWGLVVVNYSSVNIASGNLYYQSISATD